MRILLIRLRLIGDVVFTTPIPGALKRAFPGARLSYLVEEEAAPVVARHPHLDEVIVAPRRRGPQRLLDDLALARRLRAARFDLVLDLHGGPRSSLLARATGARERIGYDIPGRRWCYTRAVHRPAALRPRHSVLNQWDLLAAIPGWPGRDPEPASDPVLMVLDPDADERVRRRLGALGINGSHVLIVVHVSAGNPFRRWPEPAFAELAAALAANEPRRRLILSSGPSDREAAERIAAAARQALGPERAERIPTLGDLDLNELHAVIARSRLFVGGDTGPLHMAATTSTPIVAIFGPTLPARSAPWRAPEHPVECVDAGELPCRPCDQRVCEPGDFRCLTTLSPRDVIAAAERLLKPAFA